MQILHRVYISSRCFPHFSPFAQVKHENFILFAVEYGMLLHKNKQVCTYLANSIIRKWRIALYWKAIFGRKAGDKNDLSQNQASVGSFASALYLFSRHRCLNITARIEVYLSRFFYRMGWWYTWGLATIQHWEWKTLLGNCFIILFRAEWKAIK